MADLIARKLQMIIDGCQFDPITQPGEFPPCFESLEQYHGWLDQKDEAAQIGVPIPDREEWPAEPNYCRDCSREHRNRMRNAARCLFPSTVFVEEGDGEDAEEVGVEHL